MPGRSLLHRRCALKKWARCFGIQFKDVPVSVELTFFYIYSFCWSKGCTKIRSAERTENINQTDEREKQQKEQQEKKVQFQEVELDVETQTIARQLSRANYSVMVAARTHRLGRKRALENPRFQLESHPTQKPTAPSSTKPNRRMRGPQKEHK